jgi:hypothetical protein
MPDYAKDDWRLRYGRNIPGKPDKRGVGWDVDFPAVPGVLGYCICETREIIGGGRRPSNEISIAVSITTTPDAVFDHRTEERNTSDTPSACRIMLMHSMSGTYNRWFSDPGITLAPGSHSLTVPLQPALWVSVFGKRGDFSRSHTKAFREFLKTPVNPCLVFGGGLFFAHGTRLSSGAGSFRLLRYAA